MKYFILSTIALFLFCVGATAQGTFRGKITDENGETIIGAAVYLKNNKAIGTITDLDGNFWATPIWKGCYAYDSNTPCE
jgi:hypothetical protein